MIFLIFAAAFLAVGDSFRDLIQDDIVRGEIKANRKGNKPNYRYYHYRFGYSRYTSDLRRLDVKQTLPTCPKCAMFVDMAFQIRQNE